MLNGWEPLWILMISRILHGNIGNSWLKNPDWLLPKAWSCEVLSCEWQSCVGGTWRHECFRNVEKVEWYRMMLFRKFLDVLGTLAQGMIMDWTWLDSTWLNCSTRASFFGPNLTESMFLLNRTFAARLPDKGARGLCRQAEDAQRRRIFQFVYSVKLSNNFPVPFIDWFLPIHGQGIVRCAPA